jgi:hypothetical protein
MKLQKYNSKELVEQAKQHQDTVKDHKWDWDTFYNGYLTCYADLMLKANERR